MSSNVGDSTVYEAGDQRNVKRSQLERPERFEEGKANSHLPKDSSMCSLL